MLIDQKFEKPKLTVQKIERMQYLIISKKVPIFQDGVWRTSEIKIKKNSFKNMHTRKKNHKNIYYTYSMKISKTQDVFKIAFKGASGGHLALYYSSTIKH